MNSADPTRWSATIFAGVVLAFTSTVLVASFSGSDDNPRVIYLILLFATCCSPILLARSINGPHVLLIVMMPIYFVYYGVSDLVDVWTPQATSASHGLVSAGEVAVLLGALLLVVGYQIGQRATVRSRRAVQHRDWSAGTATALGVTLTIAGLFATWYWQVVVFRYAFGEWHIGALLATVVTAGRMALPLGLFIMAYRLVTSRSRTLAILTAACLVAELYVGFVGDSKEVALQGVAILLMTKILVDSRIPKVWLLGAVATIIVLFPIFQVYRADVLGSGVARDAAAHDFKKNLNETLSSVNLGGGEGNFGLRSFVDRSSLKGNMELVVARVGNDVPYQNGYTLGLFFNAFVPRLLWPDKPDSSVGQLFNRQFHISDFDGVYISTTFLGDFYWNFGWLGLIVGMTALGFLLGTVGRTCDLSASLSLTRLLVVGVTLYTLCVRFEDSVALEATVWVRSLLAIWVLDRLCAKPVQEPTPHVERYPVQSASSSLTAFPNLMR